MFPCRIRCRFSFPCCPCWCGRWFNGAMLNHFFTVPIPRRPICFLIFSGPFRQGELNPVHKGLFAKIFIPRKFRYMMFFKQNFQFPHFYRSYFADKGRGSSPCMDIVALRPIDCYNIVNSIFWPLPLVHPHPACRLPYEKNESRTIENHSSGLSWLPIRHNSNNVRGSLCAGSVLSFSGHIFRRQQTSSYSAPFTAISFRCTAPQPSHNFWFQPATTITAQT